MATDNKKLPNVPTLRFPEFAGEWKETTLGQCAMDSLDYGMNATSVEYDGENKYIRITDIDENTSQYISNNPVSPAGDLSDKYIVEPNDILFARTGASTGKAYLYRKEDGKLYFAGFLIRARIKPEYDSTFVFAQTQTTQYRKWVQFMSIRSGQPGINSQEYASYKFLVPSKAEQTKIATFLSLLDDRIATQSQIIKELESLMAFLINHYYRPCDNNRIALLKYYIIQRAERNRLNQKDIPVLSVNNKRGFIKQTEQFDNREVASENTSNYKIVRNNDFAYNPARINVGSMARLTNHAHGIISPMYVCFYTNSNLLPDFLEFYFDSKIFKDEMFKRLEGSVRQILTFENLGNIPISIYTTEEQKNIARRLNIIRNKIDVESELLAEYQKQKKYLLNQMFI